VVVVGVLVVGWLCELILVVYEWVEWIVCECGIVLVDIKLEFGCDVLG